MAAAALVIAHQDLAAAGAKLARTVSARVAQAAEWLLVRLAALEPAGPEPVYAGGLSRVLTRGQLREELARTGRRWSERWLTGCLRALRDAGLAETVARGRAGFQVRVLGLSSNTSVVVAPEGARLTPGDPAAASAAGRPVAGGVGDEQVREAVAIREAVARARVERGDREPPKVGWDEWREGAFRELRKKPDEVLAILGRERRERAARDAGAAAERTAAARRDAEERRAADESAAREREQREAGELRALRDRLPADARAKLARTAEHELSTSRPGWPPKLGADLLRDSRELDVLRRRRDEYSRLVR